MPCSSRYIVIVFKGKYLRFISVPIVIRQVHYFFCVTDKNRTPQISLVNIILSSNSIFIFECIGINPMIFPVIFDFFCNSSLILLNFKASAIIFNSVLYFYSKIIRNGMSLSNLFLVHLTLYDTNTYKRLNLLWILYIVNEQLKGVV